MSVVISVGRVCREKLRGAARIVGRPSDREHPLRSGRGTYRRGRKKLDVWTFQSRIVPPYPLIWSKRRHMGCMERNSHLKCPNVHSLLKPGLWGLRRGRSRTFRGRIGDILAFWVCFVRALRITKCDVAGRAGFRLLNVMAINLGICLHPLRYLVALPFVVVGLVSLLERPP